MELHFVFSLVPFKNEINYTACIYMMNLSLNFWPGQKGVMAPWPKVSLYHHFCHSGKVNPHPVPHKYCFHRPEASLMPKSQLHCSSWGCTNRYMSEQWSDTSPSQDVLNNITQELKWTFWKSGDKFSITSSQCLPPHLQIRNQKMYN